MAVREKKRLGDLLIEAGALTEEQLKKALGHQRKIGKKLGEALSDLGFLHEEDIISVLAKQLNIKVVDPEEVDPDIKLLKKIPETTARKYNLIPISRDGDVVTVAMSDPLNIFAVDEIAIKLACDVKIVVASEMQIKSAITRHYGISSSIQDAVRSLRGADLKVQTDDDEDDKVIDIAEVAVPTEAAPIAKLVETLVRQAVVDRASDIHIEPDEDNVKIRSRIDGILFASAEAPKILQNALISRIKIISNLDIAETRVPQDGRFKMIVEDKKIEFRVSTFPTIYGENIVIRILHQDATMKKLEDIGLIGSSLSKALNLFKSPFGIIIVTGPTGSGKTTTLYGALSLLNTVDKNIITVEDPVEYRLPGIRQTQINIKAGLDFAKSMRAILRQDPDVIMVGEIRDAETAEIAIQAAMTGHLVLSTLHTNDAPSAVVRLTDIGVEPFLISSGLAGIIAQRLVRSICLRCKKPVPRNEALKLVRDLPKGTDLYVGAGCMECKKSGYSGRLAIFEVMVMDEGMKKLINDRASASLIAEHAKKVQKMRTMRQDGMAKMLMGLTTLKEVKRVTADAG